MADAQFPAHPPQTPGFPNNAQPIKFDEFAGLNTKPSRPAIDDGQMYICDGFMPIGKNNCRTLYGVGASLYTADSGLTIADYFFFNIGSVAYVAVFLSDGSVVQVNVSTAVQTSIAPAGTIQTPGGFIGKSQWGSQYLIFSAAQTNGYWVWDGASLYMSGTTGPTVTLTQGGSLYLFAPTITPFGGSGSGATFSATVSNKGVTQILVTSPGSGYSSGDVVVLAFSDGGSPTRTATATATITGGVVSGVTIVDGGVGYTSSTVKVQFLGGNGSGAVGTVTASGGIVTGVTVTNGGGGYTSAPTVFISDVSNPAAAAYIGTMPFGIEGTAIEVYGGHVWVANGKAVSDTPPKTRVLFSIADSVSDFNPTLGGGAFIATDSFVRVGYTALRQTNQFLYLIGDSSLNVIGGLQSSTADSVTTTTFQNSNVDPQIGTPWPDSVQVFSRNIVYANNAGVYVSYGGSVTKVSDALDGIYSTVANSAFNPSSAVATIFGISVYMLLYQIIDQVTGQIANKLLMFDGKKWWTSSQDISLVCIVTQEIESVLTAWGTDGNSLYPLFQTASTAIQKTIQSKLFDNPDYFYTKTATRLFGVVNYYDPSAGTLNFSIDNESNVSDNTIITVSSTGLSWTGMNGNPLTWTNASNVSISWGASGLVVFPPTACGQFGKYMGITLSTNCADVAIISLAIMEQVYSTDL